jgi:excisionase family DNA binding protein
MIATGGDAQPVPGGPDAGAGYGGGPVGVLVGATEAARLLGVSAQWVRRQAADGHLGAQQVGGRWLLDADEVRHEAARRRTALERRLLDHSPPGSAPSHRTPTEQDPLSGTSPAREPGAEPITVPVAGSVGEWERESWALERQLLLAQADAAERRAQLAQLEATITQRDATIAALQSEIGRLRADRDRWQQASVSLLATFSSETGETLP